jgi:hypothetical protein
MAIRTKRFTNGLLLKPCEAGDISSLDNLNGLIFVNQSDQRLRIQIENTQRQIVTNDQSQVLQNKTIIADDNNIQVVVDGTTVDLNDALEQLKELIDDTSGAEVEIFNSTITIGSTAPSVTGIMYHKATDNISFKKANIQIFGKNNVYDGVLQMDCKVGDIPDESMQSMFSPATTPTIKFVVAENDTAFNSAVSTYFPTSSGIAKIIEQTIGSVKKYIIVGSFSFNGDSTKRNMIRLNSDGSEDTIFTENAVRTLTSPNFNSPISDIIVEPNGGLLVAGQFSNFKNSGINCLIRLDSNGNFDPTNYFNINMVGKFNIDVSANILERCTKIRVANNDIFYIKFQYVSANNYSQNIIKCNNDGITDITFTPFSVPATQNINDLLINSTYVYIVGYFLNYGGSTGLNHAARLLVTNGSIDGNFTAATATKFNSTVNRVSIQNDNKILFSGSFTDYNSISGLNRLVRLNTNLTVDDIFKNNILNKFTTTSVFFTLQSDSKILVRGTYNSLTDVFRLNSDGSDDKAFNYFSNINLSASQIVPYVFENLMFFTEFSNEFTILKKVINYPERYNEYMQATRTNEEGFVISTINDGQFVRLDISNIPTGYVGTIQVVLTGVKIL